MMHVCHNKMYSFVDPFCVNLEIYLEKQQVCLRRAYIGGSIVLRVNHSGRSQHSVGKRPTAVVVSLVEVANHLRCAADERPVPGSCSRRTITPPTCASIGDYGLYGGVIPLREGAVAGRVVAGIDIIDRWGGVSVTPSTTIK